jgi:[protein-PII] uridylyltransferase
MSGGDAAPARTARIETAKAKLEQRIADLPEESRKHALTRYYDGYWLAFNDAEHEHIARLTSDADARGELLAVSAESDIFRAVTELVVYTPDHPGLFSRIAGAIAVSGGSIVDAKAFTTSDGFALDVFSIQDAEGGPFGDPSRIGRLRNTIAKTLCGETIPRKVLAARTPKKRAAAFEVRPRVSFDNDASAIATIIEVNGLDRQGLLYEVTRAIFESGLSISSAMVATYGERAVDVFYVRDGFGHKIVHRERMAAVEQKLLQALSGESLEVATALRA